jgi:Family of unknown function (DUF5808)
MKSRRRRRRLVALTIGTALVGAAVATELRKPPDERTWHGSILGVMPYDFRPPTVERFLSRWWNPDDQRLFTPRVFGVGWDVNLARLAGL